MSARTQTPRQPAAKETAPAEETTVATSGDPDVDPVADLQEQINGLHTRIDEAQRENAGALGQILEAVNTAKESVAGLEQPSATEHEAIVLEELPEGTTRFFSALASDYQIQWAPKRYITVGQDHEIIPPRFARFANHILTTSDPDEIEALRKLCENPAFHDFVEDPLAKPVSRVKVIDGATDSGNRSQRHAGGLTPARI